MKPLELPAAPSPIPHPAVLTWGDGSPLAPHEVVLLPGRRTGSKAKHTVMFRDRKLGCWRDPENGAARALLDFGFSGYLVTRWAGEATIAMRLDIERAAARTINETVRGFQNAAWRAPSFG